MNKLDTFVREIKSQIFVNLSPEEERNLINNNFHQNIARFLFFAILVCFTQSACGIYYVFLSPGDYSLTYGILSVIDVSAMLIFIFLVLSKIGDENNNKKYTYSILTIYLVLEVFIVHIEYMISGGLMGLYFDLIIIIMLPFFTRRVITLYMFAYFACSMIYIYGFDNLPMENNSVDIENGLLMLVFLYIGFLYIHGMQLNSLILTLKVEKGAKKSEKRKLELIELNKQLSAISTTDALTQIPNRRAFDEYVSIMWNRCYRDKKPISLLIIDIDDFKKYNDTFGHVEGDRILSKVASTIKSIFRRESDLFARYGGEEFVVVLPFIDKKHLEPIAEKVVKSIETLYIKAPADCKRRFVTISVGAATMKPDELFECESLLLAADDALYKAKAKGKNCYVMADKKKDKAKNKKIVLEVNNESIGKNSSEISSVLNATIMGTFIIDVRDRSATFSDSITKYIDSDTCRFKDIDDFFEFVHRDDINRFYKRFYESVNTKSSMEELNFLRIKCKNGYYKWLSIRLIIRHDSNHFPLEVIGSFCDAHMHMIDYEILETTLKNLNLHTFSYDYEFHNLTMGNQFCNIIELSEVSILGFSKCLTDDSRKQWRIYCGKIIKLKLEEFNISLKFKNGIEANATGTIKYSFAEKPIIMCGIFEIDGGING